MANEGKLTSEFIEIFQNQAVTGRLGSEFIEIFQNQAVTGRLGSEFVEVFQNQAVTGRAASVFVEVFASFVTPVAVVPDTTGFTNSVTTFDSSGSTGSLGGSSTIVNRWWSWTSVPGGSTIANITPTPMPNSGGTSFIAMTSNAVLYHCEGNGTDNSGNANTATFSNVTTGAAGKVGSFAWSFDTIAGIATISNVVLAPSYTYAFWFFDLEPDNQYRSSASDAGAAVIPIIVEANTKFLGLWNGSFQTSGFNMPAASYTGWHHIAAVASAGTTKMYVDGILVGTVATTVSFTLARIGNSAGQNQRFAKRMDEIAVWTRALSASEVEAIYINQSGNYAGSGTTFQFTPDVTGTYTVQFSMRDSIVAGVYTDSANAVVTQGSSLSGVWPQGQLTVQPGVQGQRLKRHRGQM